ncbi:MAG: TrkA family potassium uptake protein [Clostridiales bacterium]|nr:TrkA family potassium uptake protein [Clostridiales bacterium]
MKKKQIVVIGLGRFGASVAKNLYDLGYEVLAIDSREDAIQEIADNVTHAVQADSTDEKSLKELGLGNFDVAIIGIGSDVQSNIMTTIIVKELGVKYVIAKADSDLHAKVLRKIGADRIVFPERDMGARVANNLFSASILDYIELSKNYKIFEIVALDEWVGKALYEINMRATYGINIIAIKNGDSVNVSPGANDIIHKGDLLIIIGSTEGISKFNGNYSIWQ